MRQLLFILFLLPVLLEAQTTYYVDKSGIDDIGRNGLAGQEWATLAYACTRVLTANDIIHINSGEYTWNTPASVSVNVNIEGDGNSTWIHSNNTSTIQGIIIFSGGTNTSQSLSYLKIDGNSLTGVIAISVSGGRDNVSIHHCTISNFKWYGVRFTGTGTNNSFHHNTITNCAGGTGYGYGDEGMSLQITQQTDFLCCNNKFSQPTRGATFDGNAIAGYEESYGIKIDSNTINWIARDNLSWVFAIEIFYGRGLEICNNIIQGEVDITRTYTDTHPYGLYFHDNICGFDALRPASNYGLQVESILDGVIVCNNLFKNLETPIYFCQYRDYSGSDYIDGVWVYSNLAYNIGRSNTHSTGWGIRFECGSNADNENPPQTIRNINIWHNTLIALSSYPSMIGIELPTHVRTATANTMDIRNNITKGFTTAGILARQWDNDYVAAINFLNIYDNIILNCGNGNDYQFAGVTITNYNHDTQIESDPLFVNEGSYDFHITNVSPAYQAGSIVIFPYDLGDQDNISFAEPPSIGTYELAGLTLIKHNEAIVKSGEYFIIK